MFLSFVHLLTELIGFNNNLNFINLIHIVFGKQESPLFCLISTFIPSLRCFYLHCLVATNLLRKISQILQPYRL